ncbi:HD-GYP domain-containing protein [Paenibacillus sp. KN14-4R]|uniref:HD-GYP domain-containing protein n=1 Tax=Paenibacillus sp. KN14-4R TaxID=3445773 RepID=UPI003F9F9C1C
MKYVHIDSVESGQYLGRTIFTSNGVVMLSEGVQLTVYMITTLRRIGVTMIYIKDPNYQDIVIEDVVSDETKQIVMKQMGDTFESLRSGKELNTRSLSQSIDKMLDDLFRNKEILLQLTDIRTKDNEMYVHALNVCMMSTLIGISMELNALQLKELATGALLHDVGKVEENTDDSAEDLKQHHTWRGYELLKSKREYSLLIAHCAFQHHEAIDGTGMPRGLKGEDIHLYAKIVAVANAYDNLLFNQMDGKNMLPHEACEHMMGWSNTMLDREVMIHFLKTVSIYTTGSSVRLSTKETGVVVGQHRGLPGRPIIRIIKNDGGRDMDVKEVDLSKHTTVFVEDVLA